MFFLQKVSDKKSSKLKSCKFNVLTPVSPRVPIEIERVVPPTGEMSPKPLFFIVTDSSQHKVLDM